MCGKWRYAGGALVVALGVAVMPVQAQRGQGFRGQGFGGQGGPNFGHSLELALDHQEKLGLTEDQVAQLQGLKATIDGDVAGLGEEMKGLRESIRAGEVERDEGVRQMEALRGELITASAPLRGRVQEILTVEQHNQLQPLAQRSRLGGGRAGPFQGVGRGRAFQGPGRSSVRGRGMDKGKSTRMTRRTPFFRRGPGRGPMGGFQAARGEGGSLP